MKFLDDEMPGLGKCRQNKDVITEINNGEPCDGQKDKPPLNDHDSPIKKE